MVKYNVSRQELTIRTNHHFLGLPNFLFLWTYKFANFAQTQPMSESTDNYLKAIFAICYDQPEGALTTHIATKLTTKASSVTDMLKKLDEQGLVKHRPYYGTTLTPKGKKQALKVIRKHRLWESFLVEKLGFGWSEVHEIAEQLEHIESNELTLRLESYLGFPKYDPHGDPIPDDAGNMPSFRKTVTASTMKKSATYQLVAVANSSNQFLQHMKNLNLSIGSRLTLKEKYAFDESMTVNDGHTTIHLSKEVASNLLLMKAAKK